MYNAVWIIILRGKTFLYFEYGFFNGYKFCGCRVLFKKLGNGFSSAIKGHHMYKEVCEQYRFCV